MHYVSTLNFLGSCDHVMITKLNVIHSLFIEHDKINLVYRCLADKLNYKKTYCIAPCIIIIK